MRWGLGQGDEEGRQAAIDLIRMSPQHPYGSDVGKYKTGPNELIQSVDRSYPFLVDPDAPGGLAIPSWGLGAAAAVAALVFLYLTRER